MFCSKCGSEIFEGEKFCGVCGAKMETEDVDSREEAGKKTGGKPVKLVIIVLAVLLVAAGGVFLLRRHNSGSASPRQMVYLEDEKLYYLKDMLKPDKAIQVARVIDMTELTGATFSSDGKYLYYYSDVDKKTVNAYDDYDEEYYDYEQYSYTLSRVKISKLSEKGSHDKYIERIAEGVTDYCLEDDGIIYYTDYKDRIVRYEDGKETDLKKGVKEYHVDKENNILYYSEAVPQGYEEDDLFSIGYVNMETGEDVQIDKDINEIESFSDKGYYVYWKHGDGQPSSYDEEEDAEESDDYDEVDGVPDTDVEEPYVAETVSEGESSGDIYVADGVNDPVRIAKDACSIISVNDDGMVYYDYQQKRHKMLYEFVNDTHAEEDAGIKEPEVRDCLIPMEEDEVLNIIMTDEMKEEYLTGKKKDKKRFYEGRGANGFLYDEGSGLQYRYNYDEATDTDNIYYYDEEENQWYIFDQNKNEEMEYAYESSIDRIELRRYLKTTGLYTNEFKVCCASASSDEEVVVERVADDLSAMDGRLLIYGKDIAGSTKADIDSLVDMWMGEGDGDISVIYGFLQEGSSEGVENYYKIDRGEEQKLEIDGDVYVSSYKDNSVVFAEMIGEKYNLYYSEIVDNSLSEFKKLADNSDTDASKWIGGAVYYYDGSESDKTATLCKYENGENSVVRENAVLSLGITSDSMLILHDTDLEMYDMSGQTTRIARDVSDYTYLSKELILYTSEGDLYLYTPDDSKLKIAKDINGYLIYMVQEKDNEKVYKVK